MNPFDEYQSGPFGNETRRSRSGFALAVVVILLFLVGITVGMIVSFRNSDDTGNARLVYLAACAKATELRATGNYRIPVQSDLTELVGEEVNRNAVIKVVDEQADAKIEYIIYIRNGLETRYSPGETVVTKADGDKK